MRFLFVKLQLNKKHISNLNNWKERKYKIWINSLHNNATKTTIKQREKYHECTVDKKIKINKSILYNFYLKKRKNYMRNHNVHKNQTLMLN